MVLQKQNIQLSYDPGFHLGIYTQKYWKQGLEKIFVHPCSWQHYSQQPKGGNTPNAHQWINGETMYNVILFILTKEGSSNTCYNMGEPWRHGAKWDCYQWKMRSHGVIRKSISWDPHGRIGLHGELYWCKSKGFPLLTSQHPISVPLIMEKVHSVLSRARWKATAQGFCSTLQSSPVQSSPAPGELSVFPAVARCCAVESGSLLEPSHGVLMAMGHVAARATWLWKEDTPVHGTNAGHEREREREN